MVEWNGLPVELRNLMRDYTQEAQREKPFECLKALVDSLGERASPFRNRNNTENDIDSSSVSMLTVEEFKFEDFERFEPIEESDDAIEAHLRGKTTRLSRRETMPPYRC